MRRVLLICLCVLAGCVARTTPVSNDPPTPKTNTNKEVFGGESTVRRAYIRSLSARELVAELIAVEKSWQWIDTDQGAALYDQREEVFDEILRRWVIPSTDEHTRIRLAAMLCEIVRLDRTRDAWEDTESKPLAELGSERVRGLLLDMLKSEPAVGSEVLDLMQQRQDYDRSLVVEAFSLCPPGRRDAFVLWLLPLELETKLADQVWSEALRVYERAVHDELEGRSDIRAVPWFGVGAENVTRKMRYRMLDAAEDNPSARAARLVVHAARIETAAGMRTKIATAAIAQDPELPEVKEALRTCFETDFASCNQKLFDVIEQRGWVVEFEEHLQRFAVHYRESYATRAANLLASASIEVVGTRQTEIPADTLTRLLEFCDGPFPDVSKAQRAEAFVEAASSWGGRYRSEQKRPGWWFLEEQRFVSDELDECFGTAEELGVELLDFDRELDTALQRLGQPAERDPRFGGPGFSEWIYDWPAHDLFRLVYAVRKARSENSYLPRATRLFLVLLESHENEAALLEHVAYESAWLRYLHSVNEFAAANDELARIHAEALLTLVPYSRSQTDLEGWFSDAMRIADESEIRKHEPGGELGTIEYWIARLPDVVQRQWGQPGGAMIIEEESPAYTELLKFGIEAIEPLIEELPNDRLIRSVSFWRDFARSRYLTTVGDLAAGMLAQIVEAEFHLELTQEQWALFDAKKREELKAWLDALISASKKGK